MVRALLGKRETWRAECCERAGALREQMERRERHRGPLGSTKPNLGADAVKRIQEAAFLSIKTATQIEQCCFLGGTGRRGSCTEI